MLREARCGFWRRKPKGELGVRRRRLLEGGHRPPKLESVRVPLLWPLHILRFFPGNFRLCEAIQGGCFPTHLALLTDANLTGRSAVAFIINNTYYYVIIKSHLSFCCKPLYVLGSIFRVHYVPLMYFFLFLKKTFSFVLGYSRLTMM